MLVFRKSIIINKFCMRRYILLFQFNVCHTIFFKIFISTDFSIEKSSLLIDIWKIGIIFNCCWVIIFCKFIIFSLVQSRSEKISLCILLAIRNRFIQILWILLLKSSKTVQTRKSFMKFLSCSLKWVRW